MTKVTGRKASVGSLVSADFVRVLVGPEQREFAVHRKLLCGASPFFQSSLDAVPAGLTRHGRSAPDLRSADRRPQSARPAPRPSPSSSGGGVLWLPDETPATVELFLLWLYRRRSFPSLVEAAVAEVTRGYPDPDPSPVPPATEAARRALHWDLVRLHLFAAGPAGLPALQDAATDALQDLYLRCDWDVSPQFLGFLYGRCGAGASLRLRRWAVAMAAWQIHAAGPPSPGAIASVPGGEGDDEGVSSSASPEVLPPPPGEFGALLRSVPELAADYAGHLRKMAGSGADLRVKNPQLRIPGNSLRNEERHFGFRQCSFHSHRGAVGEGRCPHSTPAGSAGRVGGGWEEEEETGRDEATTESLWGLGSFGVELRGVKPLRMNGLDSPGGFI
ncbi:hypothetical protein NKR23_g10395 [Pleurostoma richardsiae]|uniref:BTB domain-containing protein n=1 Tax=Pleurostoma richardsiae TaxID=41990 RepID=A0AA38R566_9PEZI|nr:hypothetical protein NKR23_g10395 [Pleurostoma richardsiae]